MANVQHRTLNIQRRTKDWFLSLFPASAGLGCLRFEVRPLPRPLRLFAALLLLALLVPGGLNAGGSLSSGGDTGPFAQDSNVTISPDGAPVFDVAGSSCCDGEGTYVADGQPTWSWSDGTSGTSTTLDTSLSGEEIETRGLSATVTQNFVCSADSADTTSDSYTYSGSFDVWPTCGGEMYDPAVYCCGPNDEQIPTAPGDPCVPPAKTGTTPPSLLGVGGSTGGANIERLVKINNYLTYSTHEIVEIAVTPGTVSNITVEFGPWQKIDNCSNRVSGCGDGYDQTCTPSSISVQSSKAINTSLSLTSLIPYPGVSAAVNLIGNLTTNYGMSAPDPVAYGIDGEPYENFYMDVYSRVQTINSGTISGTVKTRDRVDHVTQSTSYPFNIIVTPGTPGPWSTTSLNQPVSVSGAGKVIQSEVTECSIPCCPSQNT